MLKNMLNWVFKSVKVPTTTKRNVSGFFIDTRSVGSFENFFMGKKETSNICFVSNSDGSIVRLELINKKVADTILNQLDVSR